jgi:deoxyadenosine/deoxycytidine kinase
MKIINIGGAINSGKSTISKLLVKRIKDSFFIEVDDLISDEECKQFSNFSQQINAKLEILYSKIEIYKNKYSYIIFAYPMTDEMFFRIKNIISHGEFVIITLNPSLEKCLINRGRELNDWERNRIKEMYKQGFNSFSKSNFIINNENETPIESTNRILKLINLI